MADDASRTEAFLALSAALTGFDRFALQGTGIAALYLNTAVERGGDAFGQLLAEWSRLVQEFPEPSAQREAAIELRLMLSPSVGASACQLIMLWYTGSWYSSPEASHVVDADAYVAGLMWQAAGAHPMAAKPQGFGAWVLPPAATR